MNSFKKNENRGNEQRGVALMAALIALLLIGVITAGMITLSTTETSISANFRDEQLAFFSAKAGIEEIRDRFRPQAGSGITINAQGASQLPTVLAATGNNDSVLYITNPQNGETVAPWKDDNKYADDEICYETTGGSSSSSNIAGSCVTMNNKQVPNLSVCNQWCGSLSSVNTTYSSSVFDWKWVRITLKQNNGLNPYFTNGSNTSTSQVCWNGTNEETSSCAAPNLPVYVLTALAVTPSGSRRMVQAELSEDRLNLNVPAAVTAGGANGVGDSFASGSSNQWGVNGNDQAGCGVSTTGPAVHGVGVQSGTVGPPSTGDVNVVFSGQARPQDYSGSGGMTNDVVNSYSSEPAMLQTVSGLQNMLSTIKANVTIPVINGPASNSNISNYGTSTYPQIIYVNGDLSLSGNQVGYGILVVTGTFTTSGTVNWNGLIFVVGKGNFQGNGTDQINGALIVANTQTGVVGNSPGPTTVNFSGGGHGGVQYSSGCVLSAQALGTFHVNAVRELMK